MIVGTAGHVDHGKTALVAALTGANTDRLPEEKARGISIDLGFAYQELPDGQVLGFVDVPGHERFMKNMLAGAGGIDFVLLTVAADDGVMPQTREHLAVVDLLGAKRGAVALTKCDLADEARLAEVEAELAELLPGTALERAPILHTSAATGSGVGELGKLLERAAAETLSADGSGLLRFPVDRAFSLPGAGTVVTGVVLSGSIAVGDTVTISPAGTTARVRALHVQNREAERGFAGQRCGVNLGRIELSQVKRGDMLLAPRLHAPAERINALATLLADVPRPLAQWQAVRLHHAAAEVPARVALLDGDTIAPGAEGRIQLVLDRPIAASVGDRFVLRDAEGKHTIGGGRLVDLRAPRRRRRQPRQIALFDARAIEDPAASLAAQLAIWPWALDRDAFLRDRALDDAQADRVLAGVPHVTARGEGISWLLGEDSWKKLKCSALGEVKLFHKRFPQLLGPNLQRLQQSLGPHIARAPAAAALALMVRQGLLAHESGVFRDPGHKLGPDRNEEALWRRIVPLLGGDQRFRPPRIEQIARQLAARDFDCRRVLKLMVKRGGVVEIVPDAFFLHETVVEVARMLPELAAAGEDGTFGAAQLRDRLENGRKVTIQLLEWFDRQGMTARRGDLRVLEPGRIAAFCEESRETV